MHLGIGCYYKFCIFNFSNDCYCKHIKLDELGSCISRINVELNEDSLHAAKSHQLTQYNLEKYGEYTAVPNRYKRLREEPVFANEDDE